MSPWVELEIPASGASVVVYYMGGPMPIDLGANWTPGTAPVGVYTDCAAPVATYGECAVPVGTWLQKEIP